MNAKNLRLVADAVEKSETFDQTMWMHKCGTPACIAGHAAYLSLKNGESFDAPCEIAKDGRMVADVCGRSDGFLGISEDEANALYCATGRTWAPPFGAEFAETFHADDKVAMQSIAVRYLRHLADEADKAAP